MAVRQGAKGGLPDAVGGLLTKVNDAVVSVQGYFAGTFRQNSKESDEELEDHSDALHRVHPLRWETRVPKGAQDDSNVPYGPDGMPLQGALAAPAPRRAACGLGEQSDSEEGPSEVVLECVRANGVDLSKLHRDFRSLYLGGGDGRWVVGRMAQADLFARLVPDEALRVCISRCHFELSRAPAKLAAAGAALCLRKRSQNELLVDGTPARGEVVPVPQGAELGFCTPSDTITPFLIFHVHVSDRVNSQEPSPGREQQQEPQQQMQLPRTQIHSDARAPPQAVQQQQHEPQWEDPAPLAAFSLVCVSAKGSDVNTLPKAAKSIGVHAHEPLIVGRQHQTGFFEKLLGAEQRYLTIVGRSHFELAPEPGERGTFCITNLSSNPIVSGQARLGKGQQCSVRPPTCIMFIASRTGNEGDSFPFMTLNFEPSHNQVSAAQLATSPAMLTGAITGARDGPYAIVNSAAAQRAGSVGGGAAAAADAATQGRPSQVAGTSLPTALLPPASAAAVVTQQQPHAAGRATLPVPPAAAQQQQQQTEASSSGKTAFWLELSGTAVRAGASASSRQLQGSASGLTVGRLHQKELQGEALAEDVAQYVSREHFRVEPNMICGGFSLTALSTNLLWLSRAGQRAEAKRNEPLPLVHGDVVQLYTGACDYTPDGPGSLGTLYWIFYDAAAKSAGTSARYVDDTVPVPKQVAFEDQAPLSPRGSACPPHMPASFGHERPPSLSRIDGAGSMKSQLHQPCFGHPSWEESQQQPMMAVPQTIDGAPQTAAPQAASGWEQVAQPMMAIPPTHVGPCPAAAGWEHAQQQAMAQQQAVMAIPQTHVGPCQAGAGWEQAQQQAMMAIPQTNVGAGWEHAQHQAMMSLPQTSVGAYPAATGWEQLLPVPGTPVSPRAKWSGGMAWDTRPATPPPRSPSTAGWQQGGWGAQATMDYSLNHFGARRT